MLFRAHDRAAGRMAYVLGVVLFLPCGLQAQQRLAQQDDPTIQIKRWAAPVVSDAEKSAAQATSTGCGETLAARVQSMKQQCLDAQTVDRDLCKAAIKGYNEEATGVQRCIDAQYQIGAEKYLAQVTSTGCAETLTVRVQSMKQQCVDAQTVDRDLCNAAIKGYYEEATGVQRCIDAQYQIEAEKYLAQVTSTGCGETLAVRVQSIKQQCVDAQTVDRDLCNAAIKGYYDEATRVQTCIAAHQ